jgi:TonB-linked SusC/RagA family outer membrane protein
MLKKNNSSARLFCMIALLLISSSLTAQKRITGKITNKDNNQPVVGATVLVKGTNNATLTNADGAFEILANDNAVLVITVVGHKSQEIAVGGRSAINIAMETTMSSLEEVVVTGYTAQRKRDLTGAISVVKPDEMTKIASPSFNQQIEGKASGVSVTTSGQPGAAASIRIRGNSTFTLGGGEPLLVIDGVQVRGAYQNTINPNDIESIQVLKDAATTAAYGIGANNGVIIITTKKGKAGQPKIEFSSYIGTQSASNSYDKIMLGTAQEYADLVYQSYNNAGQWPQPGDAIVARIYGVGAKPVLPEYVNPLPANANTPIVVDPATYNYPNNLIMKASPGTNWWDAVFRDASIQEYNLSASGGSERGRYFFSANYFDQEGIMRYTDFRRYTLRANSDFKVKGFTFGETFTMAFSDGVGQPNGNQVEQNTITEGILKMQPIIPVYDIAGNWGGTKAGFGNGKNGLAKVFRNKDNRGETYRMLAGVFGEVRFLNHFTGRISYGIDYTVNFQKNFTFIDYESNEQAGSNGFNEQTDRFKHWIFAQQLTYNNNFGDHSVKAVGVHESQLNEFRSVGGSLNGYFLQSTDLWYLNTGLADPATRTVFSNGGTNNAKESYVGRVEYGYKGKYLLNATARYDQSSNFAVDKGQTFGGIGAAWVMTDENFLANVTWLNSLKLRGAWGVTGNDAINGNVNYTTLGGGPGNTFYDINGTNTSVATGYSITQLGLPVVWEKQKQYNIGLDGVLLRNWLEFSFDVYQRSNKDFLFQISQPGTAGLFGTAVGPPYYNLGQISNNGFEFSMTWRDRIAKDWKYDITANFTFNKNNIDELAEDLGLTSFFPAIPETRIGPVVRNEVGHPMSTFYGYTLDGIFQSDAEAAASNQVGAKIGRFRWKDVNGDKKIDDLDKGVIGDPNPDVIFGFNFNIAYKSFDFSMFLNGTLGNEIFNYTRYFTDFFGFSGNRSKRMLYDSWTPSHTDAKLPLLDITDNYSFQPSSYYVEDGSYLRCRVLQIGYRFPTSLLSKAKIDNARIYIQGQNLFTITNYGGLDPAMGTRDGTNATEVFSNVDYGNYPTARVLLIGLNLSF